MCVGRLGAVAQLAEASDLKSDCCGFDSHPLYVDKANPNGENNDELSDAIDAMGRATFRFYHWIADDLENPQAHAQLMSRMRRDLPQAHAALKDLLTAINKVKLLGQTTYS